MARRIPPEARFWEHVDRRGPDECWPWKLYLNVARGGYGAWSLWQDGRTVTFRAHRLVVHYTHGLALEDRSWLARHTCDNPPCCNPSHLIPGSTFDNAADAVERGRTSRGTSRHNAKMSDEWVRSARRRYAAGGTTQDALAAEVGVAQRTVSKMILRQTWRHVA